MPQIGGRRELELVEGTVASLIFQNEENGYTILRLERGGEELTVVGQHARRLPRGVPVGAGALGAPRHLRRPVQGGDRWSAACPRA